MKRRWKIVAGACCALAVATAIYAGGKAARQGTTRQHTVRPSAAAGRFYPADAKELRRQVKGFLESAEPRTTPGQRTIALIAPHAGYVYSGETAGRVYAYLKGTRLDRVVVIAPSHFSSPAGAWVDDADFHEIPGSRVPVDREAVAALGKAGLPAIPAAAPREHSIEVQLPFLVEALEPGWKLVPVLIAGDNAQSLRNTAAAIRTIIDERTVVCVSSDFTHYGSPYGYVPFTGSNDEIRDFLAELDGKAIRLIVDKDADGFSKYCKATGATICGRGPIVVLLKLLGEDSTGGKIAYTTSAARSGDYSMSVSYAAILFEAKQDAAEAWTPFERKDKTMSAHTGITPEEKSTLLAIARATLISCVTGGKAPDASEFTLTDSLKEKRGAFVTLEIGGTLRGCIGYVEGIEPLWQTVRDNTVNAALRDPRFHPVGEDELDKITIEISAMSPLETITDPEIIEVGKHGIMLSNGPKRGLLLPQVATEYAWDREEFLRHTCRKAGLAPDAWKDPATTIEIFSAEVFGEENQPQ